jgi:hypothetical protein
VDAYDGIDACFSAHERLRGAEYALQGRVRLHEFTPERVRATVHGTRVYSIEIGRAGSAWALACSCPAFADAATCKHLWAAVKVARSRLDAAGGVPPARHGGERKTILTQLRRSLARLEEPPHASDARDWRGQLEELEAANAESALAGARIELRYVLRVGEQPWESHVLETRAAYQRSPTSKKQFRVSVVRPLDRERLDAIDRRAFSMLWGASAGSHGGAYAYSRPFGARWDLPCDLQLALLSLLATAGRLHFESVNEPLRPDDGGEWTFALHLRSESGRVVLEGSARRGEECLPLDSLDAVLEGGLFVARGVLSTIDWRGAAAWVSTLCGGAIRVPIKRAKTLLALVERMPGDPHLDAPEFVTTLRGAPRGLVRLRAAPWREGWLEAEVIFDYGEARVARAEWRTLRRDGERLFRVERDAAAERRLEDALGAAGAQFLDTTLAPPDALVPANALAPFVEASSRAGWLVEAEGTPLRTKSKTSVSVSSGIDWFEVGADVQFDDVSAEMPELLRALSAGERFVKLSDGSRGLLPETWLAQWGLCAAIADVESGALRVRKDHAWLLDAWLREHAHVDVDAEFARVRAAFARGAQPRACAEPDGFRGELRAYQREGLGWLEFLSETGLGGCLADDMGLGKTVQVAALLLARRKRARGPSLVVAPRSVLYNWDSELRRFTPDLTVVVHHGVGRTRKAAALEDADVVVTSYGTLLRDATLLGKLDLDCACSTKRRRSRTRKACPRRRRAR